VVASEVKTLAEQTSKATNEIGQHVVGIQTATQEAVTTIREVSQIIRRISEIASAIAGSVEEQGMATQEITRNAQQAARGTGDVSSNIAGVSHAADDAVAASGQVQLASTQLAKQGEELGTEVQRFLRGIRAA
jgi:methyl-accepting chemotaxis protein